jgi:hypothetical protein
MKHLVTGGCSFSAIFVIERREDDWRNITWPKHLDNYLGIEAIHTGTNSIGNGFISRKVMYEVDKLLKNGAVPEEILVGIMWSAPKRYGQFWNGEWLTITTQKMDVPEKDLLGLENETSKQWYDKFYDDVGSQIRSWEYINATQDYLKRVNVNYFMMNFFSYVVEEHKDDPNVSWLRDRIDTSKWPLWPQGQNEWILENASDLPWDNDDISGYGNHPGEKQHMRWTEQVIIPYLKDTYDTL